MSKRSLGGGCTASPKKPRCTASAITQHADTTPGHINASYNARIADAITTVLSCPVFESLMSEDALTISDGGFKAAYKTADCKVAMKNEGKYEASTNLLVCNMFWAPDGNVPRSLERLRRLANALFPPGCPPVLSHPIVVALDTPDADPMQLMGNNKVISPIEILHALWLRAEDMVESGADEATLRSFHNCFRSATITFRVVTKDVHFEAVNIRDQFVAISAEIERTVWDPADSESTCFVFDVLSAAAVWSTLISLASRCLQCCSNVVVPAAVATLWCFCLVHRFLRAVSPMPPTPASPEMPSTGFKRAVLAIVVRSLAPLVHLTRSPHGIRQKSRT